MKKILFAVAILLASVSAQAQQQRREFNPEQNATRQADRIKETCQTNDEQYKALYDLFLADANRQKAQMDSLRANGGMEQGQGQRRGFNREEMQKRREATDAKIKAILTAEQYAKYEEAQKQMRERFGQRGGGQRGGQRNQQ